MEDVLEPLPTIFISVIKVGDLRLLHPLREYIHKDLSLFIKDHMTEEKTNNFLLSLYFLNVMDSTVGNFLRWRISKLLTLTVRCIDIVSILGIKRDCVIPVRVLILKLRRLQ